MPLFTLYALYNEKQDDPYWDRLQKWNRQTDLALMNFLGVDPRFYVEDLTDSHFSGIFSLQNSFFFSLSLLKRILFSNDVICLLLQSVGAVDCLQQLSNTLSPGEKLEVVRSTFQEINRAAQSRVQAGYFWNMDDLFPVFQFVVVRSRIRHLGAEIQLIDDLMERRIQDGELDIMFTTLKVCPYGMIVWSIGAGDCLTCYFPSFQASYFHIRQEKMTFS